MPPLNDTTDCGSCSLLLIHSTEEIDFPKLGEVGVCRRPLLLSIMMQSHGKRCMSVSIQSTQSRAFGPALWSG